MSAPGGTLLLLGARRGALAAAERLGLRVLLLADRASGHVPAGAVARRAVAPPQADDEERLRLALELCTGEAVGAVLAVSERNVRAAALARARLGLPGIDPETAERCTDKRAMKRAAAAAGLACTPWIEVDGLGPDELVERIGLPLVLKPPCSSGSRGVVFARRREDLEPLPAGPLLAERFVEGVEMSVESFVHDGRVLFVNPTQYLVRLHANVLPAPPEPERWRALLELNARAIAALGARRGMTHLEAYLTPDGPVFGELAARPPGGRLMRLLRRAYGFDPWELALRLELGDLPPRLPARARRCAGTWILHPGAGRLAHVPGLEAARALPGVRSVRLRVGAGERVERREGSGQDIGCIDAEGATPEEVAETLRAAHAALGLALEPPRGG